MLYRSQNKAIEINYQFDQEYSKERNYPIQYLFSDSEKLILLNIVNGEILELEKDNFLVTNKISLLSNYNNAEIIDYTIAKSDELFLIIQNGSVKNIVVYDLNNNYSMINKYVIPEGERFHPEFIGVLTNNDIGVDLPEDTNINDLLLLETILYPFSKLNDLENNIMEYYYNENVDLMDNFLRRGKVINKSNSTYYSWNEQNKAGHFIFNNGIKSQSVELEDVKFFDGKAYKLRNNYFLTMNGLLTIYKNSVEDKLILVLINENDEPRVILDSETTAQLVGIIEADEKIYLLMLNDEQSLIVNEL